MDLFIRQLAMEAGTIIELPRAECYSVEPVISNRTRLGRRSAIAHTLVSSAGQAACILRV